ncbi:MAG: NUDIX hydrolase [Clostridia bacterium]|nr:NUDIX hydrolase [Clostridia bacterium]
MDLRQAIVNYDTILDQEVKDRKMFFKYLNTFEDVFTRKNETVHFTSSAFITNKDRTKVLMIYHNIYNSWGWIGGHADGEKELLSVAIKEIEEETGVTRMKVLSDIATIDTLPVPGHVKKGKYVPAHIHLSIAYMFEADESEPIRIKADENSNVGWIDVDKVVDMCTEEHMKPIYKKLLKKLKEV